MHVTTIVSEKQTTDETYEVTIRCCENPLTDSTLTIYGFHKHSPEHLDEIVGRHHDRVAAKCNGMGAGRLLIASGKIKKSKTHEAI